MKQKLLQFLLCPSCGGGLSLKKLENDGSEITEGTLLCSGCKNNYPIISGIPRMLPESMIKKEILSHFKKKYGESCISSGEAEKSDAQDVKERTSKSFGFQWNVFPEMYVEYEKNFLDYIDPKKPSFFKGKVVLDAGCGFGRHTYYAAKYGADVIGFDLSDAVDAAHENCKELSNVHIVQGDIYNPPFRKTFDFIMSIGVLHHLPYPEKGYQSLVSLLRTGDEMFAWLYGSEGRPFKTVFLEGTIRKIAVKMPQKMLYYFCYLPAILYHTTNQLYHIFRKIGANGLAKKLPFKNYTKFPFRVKLADTYDFLGTPINNYYTKEESEQWAKNAKLRNISVTSLGGRSWRIFGKK